MHLVSGLANVIIFSGMYVNSKSKLNSSKAGATYLGKVIDRSNSATHYAGDIPSCSVLALCSSNISAAY